MKVKLKATITLTFLADSEDFPIDCQTPTKMAAFTEKQILDGDASVEDVVGWGEDHEVKVEPK